MRVVLSTLHLASENLGGAWVYTWKLIKSLERFRTDLDLIILANQGTAGAFQTLQHAVHVAPVDAGNRLRRVAWEQFSLAREIERYGADVYHGTGNVLPRNLRTKTVVTVHDFQWHYFPENFSLARRMYLRSLVRGSVASASHVICISESTRTDVRALCRVPEENVSVIYEAGLDPAELSQASDPAGGRSPLVAERPVILSVGSSLPHKNLRRLIQAFGQIAGDVPHDLVLVGESFGYQSELAHAVKELARRHGNRIRFTGFVSRDELMRLYRSSDMFVFPSLFEGFGIPAVEAMGAGVPVVVSSATSLPEVVGTAGEYFDPADVDDIARAMKRVCLDRARHDELCALGLVQARKFSWDEMAARTFDVYKHVMKK